MALGDLADHDAVVAELVEADHLAFDCGRRVADDRCAVFAGFEGVIAELAVNRLDVFEERGADRFLPAPSIERVKIFDSLTSACAVESALIPTTTSGGLKLAWVSQLTVATVCLSPWRAPSTNSP